MCACLVTHSYTDCLGRICQLHGSIIVILQTEFGMLSVVGLVYLVRKICIDHATQHILVYSNKKMTGYAVTIQN